jgi:hypothetical protein
MKTSIFVVLSTLALISCSGSAFHQNYKKIAGTFYLLRWEDDKTYYIVEDKHLKDDEIGGGALSGTVLQLGFDSEFIVAKRYATFRGDRDGWMVINLTSNKVEGPITDNEEEKRFPGLKLMPPSDAWDSLQ